MLKDGFVRAQFVRGLLGKSLSSSLLVKVRERCLDLLSNEHRPGSQAKGSRNIPVVTLALVPLILVGISHVPWKFPHGSSSDLPAAPEI